MNRKHVLIGLMAGVTLTGTALNVQAADQPVAKAAAPSDQQLIASAMAAAPLAIGKAATIVAMTADLAEGKAVYQQSCASCHGVAGLGDGPAAGRNRYRSVHV